MNVRLTILGFGNVGRAFARLLLRKAPTLEADYDLICSVVGLMTARHGGAIDPDGVDLKKALNLVESGASLDILSTVLPPDDSLLFLHACSADVLVELTPLNLNDGEPAVSHVRTALERGCTSSAPTRDRWPLHTVSCVDWPHPRSWLFFTNRR